MCGFSFMWTGDLIGWIIHPIIRLNRLTNTTHRISLAALLAASAVASNYLLIGVVNVKFMDLIVFTSGYLLGPRHGVLTGVLVWLVYGTLNPYGFSLPVFIATTLGESMFGLAGAYYPRRSGVTWLGVDFWAAFSAFLLTLVYDLFTNTVSALTAGIPVPVALVTGIPFTLAHVLSNTLFFAVGFKPLTNSINHILGEKSE